MHSSHKLLKMSSKWLGQTDTYIDA